MHNYHTLLIVELHYFLLFIVTVDISLGGVQYICRVIEKILKLKIIISLFEFYFYGRSVTNKIKKLQCL